MASSSLCNLPPYVLVNPSVCQDTCKPKMMRLDVAELEAGAASRSSSTCSSLLYAAEDAAEAASPTAHALSANFERFQRCRLLRRTLLGDTALFRDLARGGKLVVLKRVSVRALQDEDPRSHENPLREHAVIRLLDAYDRSAISSGAPSHPGRAHVVSFERDAVFADGDDVFVAMEFCAGGDLYDHVTRQQGHRLEEREALRLTAQLAKGLQFLHERLNVAHRDLSLENVLLSTATNGAPVAKLCDFGLSMDAAATSSDAVGKFYYMAPEVAACLADPEAEPYDPKAADVWSLGVMLFIMLTGSPLFAEDRTRAPTLRVLAKYGVSKVLELWGNLQRQYSRRTVNLLACMLQVHPEHRLTIDEVVRHPALRATAF